MLQVVKTTETKQQTETERLADELLHLKQAYDSAKQALEMAKVRARDVADLGPNGKQLEVVTAEAWLRVKRSGRYSAPTDAELDAIGPEVAGRLFRRNRKVKPNSRANWRSFLKKLDAAGIDHDGFFVADETMQAVKDFGEAVAYEMEDLEGTEPGEALEAMVQRITQAPTVTIQPADMRKDKQC